MKYNLNVLCWMAYLIFFVSGFATLVYEISWSRQIDIEFADDTEGRWPKSQQIFEIRHLPKSIDTQSRTFDCFIPLANQSRAYGKQGKAFLV